MELREYLAVMRRRLWILLAVPTVAALTAALLSLFAMKPVYEASTTLWVIKQEAASLDYTTLLLNRNLVKTYGEVAQSRAVMQAVMNKLRLSESLGELQKRIQVTPVRDTEIIEITVQDGEAKRAADIANAVAATFTDEIGKFIRLDNVRVVDPAVVPLTPVKPRPLLNTAIALVLGAMAAVGLTFLLESLDVTIRTPEDAERHLGLPVLGMIPLIAPVEMESEQGAGADPATRSRRRRSAHGQEMSASMDMAAGGDRQ